MTVKFKQILSGFIAGLFLFFIQGCSNPEQTNVNRVFQEASNSKIVADKNYISLENHISDPLKKGKYEMALAVALANVSSEFPDNPAVSDMVKQFNLDTTKMGSIWKQIESDYKVISSNPSNSLFSNTEKDKPTNQLGNLTNLLVSYNAFNNAHNLNRLDERFIDYINTLAAISKNVNPVIVDKVDSNAPVGSAFVGNPQYGEWKKDNNGNDMWQFLETYMYLSFLDNMLFDKSYKYGYNDYRNNYRSNPYGYNSPRRNGGYNYDKWSNNRNYSYYNDTYVNKYSKSSERKKYNLSQSNLTKKYSKTIKKDNLVSKQMKTLSPKNKAFQSNLSKPKTKPVGSQNSSSSKKISQSNLSKSSKSVRTPSQSVSRKSGK